MEILRNMRTPLLAGLVAVLLPACLANEISGVGDEDMMDMGSGSGSGSGSGGGAIARLDASVDRTTVTTELGKTELVQLTLTGVNGFAGTVPITLTLLDANNMPITTGYTLTATPASVDVPTDGTVTAMVSVKIPTNPSLLTPTLKIDLGGTAPTNIQSSLAIANKYTIDLPAGTGTGAHTSWPAANAPVRIKSGTMVVFHNSDSIQHIVHGSNGIDHEDQTNGGQPGGNYELALTSDGTWYCHTHNIDAGSPRPIIVE